MSIREGKSQQSVLVTGAAGFLGGYVVRTLFSRGYRIVAHQHRTALPREIEAKCDRVVSGDICEAAVQHEMLQDVQVVVHLAAYIPSQFKDLRDAEKCFLINAGATQGFAEKAALNGITNFVFISAGNMYAPSDIPCSESDRIFPSEYATDYFVSKQAAEIFLMNIDRRSAMDVTILRVGTPYGPEEPHSKVIPFFLRCAMQGESIRLLNGGEASYNYVYAEDVADVTAQVIKDRLPGIFNVGSGEHTRLMDLADTVANLYEDRDVTIEVEPAVGEVFKGFPAISIEKIRKQLGYNPRSLVEGLAAYRAVLEEECGQ